MNNLKEYILCAAIKRKTPRNLEVYHRGKNDIHEIEIGYRHPDIIQRFKGELDIHQQGFYTSKGRFVDRITAKQIAEEAGQIEKLDTTLLYSEDLY